MSNKNSHNYWYRAYMTTAFFCHWGEKAFSCQRKFVTPRIFWRRRQPKRLWRLSGNSRQVRLPCTDANSAQKASIDKVACTDSNTWRIRSWKAHNTALIFQSCQKATVCLSTALEFAVTKSLFAQDENFGTKVTGFRYTWFSLCDFCNKWPFIDHTDF